MRNPVSPKTSKAGFAGGGALFFLLLLVAAIVVFLTVFPPSPKPQSVARVGELDPGGLEEYLQPEAVSARMDKILQRGNRLTGSAGARAVAKDIEVAARGAGLEVVTLDFRSVVPRTERRELMDVASGRTIEVFPFLPNHFQPTNTGPKGVSGELVLLTDEEIHNRASFTGVIGLIDADHPPKGFGLDVLRYAQLGLSGIVLAHRNGLQAVDWDPLVSGDENMSTSLPINFARVAAGAEVFAWIGQPVRLQVEGKYVNASTSTIVATLKAAKPSSEALVITTGYDAWSVLPDQAPGILQASQLVTVLALMDGLATYRETLERDVIFVFSGAQMMANEGDAVLLSAMGTGSDKSAAKVELEERRRQNTELQAQVAEILPLFDDPGFLVEGETTLKKNAQLSAADRKFFQEQLTYILDTIIFERSDAVLTAGLAWDGKDGTPQAELYQKVRNEKNVAMAVGGLRLEGLLESRLPFLHQNHIREQLQKRLEELAGYHAEQTQFLDVSLGLNRQLGGYRALSALSPRLLPGKGAEAVGFVLGTPWSPMEEAHRLQGPSISRLAASVLQDSGEDLAFVPTTAESSSRTWSLLGLMPSNTALWNQFGYPAFSLVNRNRLDSYRALALPVEKPFMRDLASLKESLQFTADLVLAIAHGEGVFRSPLKVTAPRYAGTVYLSGVGRSLTPNYPLVNALVGSTLPAETWADSPGRYNYLLKMTDPYGAYETGSTPAYWVKVTGDGYSPQAFGFNSDGVIDIVKDISPKAQNIFQSINLSPARMDQTGVNIVTFRADPFAILDMLNPQSLQPYDNALMLTRDGLSGVGSSNRFANTQASITFLPPELPVYVTLRAGSPDNELVQSVRGFLLGAPDENGRERLAGINGVGYESGFLSGPFTRTAWDLAESMLRVNSTRLALQEKSNLADQRTIDFQNKAAALWEQSRRASSQRESLLRARDSATYSTMVHPVLRGNISGAVISILWYLGLLVPFVFFFERLVFGFTDIRKQLAAQAIVFLIVFGLLNVLHPAFAMIRSSLMILLGFLILLISLGITLLFAGKFRENLEELQHSRGQVSAAEPDKMGIIGTAFMLGLNNMHRRKVRTGLTCGTLVLITFAMIAFTSIQNDMIETEVALGPADYQGFLVKNNNLAPVGQAEQFGLQTKYGTDHVVTARTMFTGVTNVKKEVANPDLEIVYDHPKTGKRSARFMSILQFAHNEPLRAVMPVAGGYWFPDPAKRPPGALLPVVIPKSMAETLGIEDPAKAGPVPVKINGGAFEVVAVFDPEALAALHDLDGDSLLPFDVRGIQNIRTMRDWTVLADAEEPRIPADDVVLMPLGAIGINVPNSNLRTSSVAVSLAGLDYQAAREVVVTRLEQSAVPTYYGLDGVRYFGSRLRKATFEGLLDLIIPLVIAGLTVLNTMKGSVYERREEIFVYNAVGIAPRYIFFMFIAEAFVYAVMGAVLGYLLSQGVGRILTETGLTGGLNMTFAGLNSIYASLAVMAAVFISTYFPARSAMQIASPADESGWALPEPEGDRLTFMLPFTFDAYDRMAVLAFFRRYLLDHGEGGSGRFSAGPPAFDVDHGHEGPVPVLETTIWLKPFDLGVSQTLRISLPYDPETNEFIAKVDILRSSGTRESWQRLNHGFLVLLRKQFLHWRAVTTPQKHEFHQEARSAFESACTLSNQEVAHV